MEESIFFKYGDVEVTSARFINGGQTYAMNTSVAPYEKKTNRTGGVIVLLIGIVNMFGSSLVTGLLISAAAAYYLYQQKNYILATSAGETTALVTHQRNYMNEVIAALNNPIVHRGDRSRPETDNQCAAILGPTRNGACLQI